MYFSSFVLSLTVNWLFLNFRFNIQFPLLITKHGEKFRTLICLNLVVFSQNYVNWRPQSDINYIEQGRIIKYNCFTGEKNRRKRTICSVRVQPSNHGYHFQTSCRKIQ